MIQGNAMNPYEATWRNGEKVKFAAPSPAVAEGLAACLSPLPLVRLVDCSDNSIVLP